MENIGGDRYKNIGEREFFPEWVVDWLLACLTTGQVECVCVTIRQEVRVPDFVVIVRRKCTV